MDWVFFISGAILLMAGIVGCILPIIPGPPLAYLSLIVLQIRDSSTFSVTLLVICGIITVLVTVLDYVVPVWGTKKFGGSKYGVWGSTIGLFIGLFFAPFGLVSIIIGPFLGAIIGELIGGNIFKMALKSGIGSLIGFLFITFMKFVVSIWIGFYFLKEAAGFIGDKLNYF